MSTLKSNNENLILNADGATSDVEIQSNGSTKLTTTSTGVDVNGKLVSDTAAVEGSSNYLSYVKLNAQEAWYQKVSTTSNRWNLHLNGTGDMMAVATNGDVHAEGDVIAYSTTISDERLKTDIKPIENALDKVSQLNGYTFTYTADGKESAGLIAQEVEKVLPSAVSEKELPLKTDDGETYKVLQYDQTIGLLVEAVKELTARVEELEAK